MFILLLFDFLWWDRVLLENYFLYLRDESLLQGTLISLQIYHFFFTFQPHWLENTFFFPPLSFFSPCFAAFLCRVEPKSVVSSWIDFIFLLVCLFLIFLSSFFTILPFFLLRYLRLFPSPPFAFPLHSFLARVRVHTGSCIFCCHKCHTLRVTFSILLLLTSFFCFRHCFLLFFLRTLFLHPLSHFSVSSACSSSNDGLFY